MRKAANSILSATRPLLDRRDVIFGVDFSGARNAERHIWLARGLPRDGGLHIDACAPIGAWCAGVRGPEQAAIALRELIERHGRAAFALDFPFGLPATVLEAGVGWRRFVAAFPGEHPDAKHFREHCRELAGDLEPRRETDRAAATPFCPYNLRLFRQTYHGIVHVLAPLVAAHRASVPPMLPLHAHRPWLLEICPASTLKAMGIYRPYSGYKRSGPQSRRGRERILARIAAAGPITLARGLKGKILADAGGDALDSVIAAFTAFKLLQAPHLPTIPAASRKAALREAWVYRWPPGPPP